jgi:3-oxoacyl-[acyl-carrier-protein] synthase-1
MKGTSILSGSIISPLGVTVEDNFNALRKGISGVSLISDPALGASPFYASKIESVQAENGITRFEKIVIQSIQQALTTLSYPINLTKTVFILSTTKGEIEKIGETTGLQQVSLHATADKLAKQFGFQKSYVVSNACTSGLMALITAKRLLKAGRFDFAVVTGADVLSNFVVSGFQSLFALSDEPCKPFDQFRKGLNLGEASATLVLSSMHDSDMVLLGDASTNDANHISGPSRTGNELAQAITSALAESEVKATNVDFISAHGTATLYNDEMEAKAFTYAKVNHIPVNSLKGYFGHTLGAAGLVEIVMSLQSLKQNELIATQGYSKHGVSLPMNIISKPESRNLKTFLKTASGFGGCNAALVLQKL